MCKSEVPFVHRHSRTQSHLSTHQPLSLLQFSMRLRGLRLDDHRTVAEAGALNGQLNGATSSRRADYDKCATLVELASIALIGVRVLAISVAHGRNHARSAYLELKIIAGAQ